MVLQAAWVAGQYAGINFADQGNFSAALHSVVAGLRDPELPVRVDSVFALRSFVEACKGKFCDNVYNNLFSHIHVKLAFICKLYFLFLGYLLLYSQLNLKFVHLFYQI